MQYFTDLFSGALHLWLTRLQSMHQGLHGTL